MKLLFAIEVLEDQKAYYVMMVEHIKTTITPHEDYLCACIPEEISRLKSQMERYEGYVKELNDAITVLTNH